MGRPSRFTTAAQNAGLTVGAFMLGLVFLEALLRLTHLAGARLAWTTPDPVIGYRLVPLAEYWSTRENDHPVSGRINRFGWVDREWDVRAPGRVRIALLGDSFLEAIQVERESTFVALAEHALRLSRGRPLDLMNFGLSGTTQSEQLLLLQRDVLPLSPDMVVLFFYAGNDIADIGRTSASHTQRPFFVPSGNSLVLDTSFAASPEYALRRLLDPLKRRSALVSLVTERLTAWRQRTNTSAFHEVEPYVLLCTAAPPQLYRENFALNLRLMAAMDSVTAARGIPFGVVVLPLPWYRREVAQRIARVAPDFDGSCFDRRIQALGTRHGFAVLPLQRAFAEADAAGSDMLLWRNVGHLTYAGHRLVARELAGWLDTVAPPGKEMAR